MRILFPTFLVLALSASTQAFSAQCVQTSPAQVKVSWTAFKTPEKVGVTGSLTGVELQGKTSGESIEAVANNMAVAIDPKSIFTDNPARDQQIVRSFFSGLKGKPKIQAKIVEMSKDKLKLELELNGVKKIVPMKFQVADQKLSAQGVIDVLDFAMSSQLKALNKACMALHEGKTWSDVQLMFEASFQACP